MRVTIWNPALRVSAVNKNGVNSIAGYELHDKKSTRILEI